MVLAAGLSHDRHRLAVALASIPEQIRGYGHVKQADLDKAMKR
jgi:indolepyruvate ferredoxin oxidoreductase